MCCGRTEAFGERPDTVRADSDPGEPRIRALREGLERVARHVERAKLWKESDLRWERREAVVRESKHCERCEKAHVRREGGEEVAGGDERREFGDLPPGAAGGEGSRRRRGGALRG